MSRIQEESADGAERDSRELRESRESSDSRGQGKGAQKSTRPEDRESSKESAGKRTEMDKRKNQ